MKKVILIVIILIIAIVAIGAFLLLRNVKKELPALEKQVTVFLEYAANSGVDSAHTMLAEGFKKKMTKEALASFFAQNKPLFSGFKSQVNTGYSANTDVGSPTVYSYTGDITYDNGDIGEVSAKFIKENGELKLVGINVKVDPKRIEDFNSSVSADTDIRTLFRKTRDNSTREDRESWHRIVGWSQEECRGDFSNTDDGGIHFEELGLQAHLGEVECELFAYQGSYLYFLLDMSREPASVKRLMFEMKDQKSGEQLTTITSGLLTGVPSFNKKTKELTVFKKARGIGDCGVEYVYTFPQNTPKLKESTFIKCMDNLASDITITGFQAKRKALEAAKEKGVPQPITISVSMKDSVWEVIIGSENSLDRLLRVRVSAKTGEVVSATEESGA